MKFLFRPFVLIGLGIIALAAVVFYVNKTDFSFGLIAKPTMFLYQKFSLVAKIYDRFTHWSDQTTKLQALEEENKALLARLADYDFIYDENVSLRHALGIPMIKSASVIDASISGANLNPGGKDLILNKGAADLIQSGDIVVSPEGFLVGTISEVKNKFSFVIPVSDPGIVITVKNIDSNTTGIAKGVLTEGMKVDFISQDDEIREGDLMVTSGSDQYPPGLIIGKVVLVKISAGSLFKEVKITPFIQEVRFDKVFVLKRR